MKTTGKKAAGQRTRGDAPARPTPPTFRKATKRGERPVHQLPHEPAISLSANDLREAAADLYGFWVIETRDLLWAERKRLRAGHTTNKRVKLRVVEELAHQADIALELPAAWGIGDQRWGLAIDAGLGDLDRLDNVWVKAAKIRIRELYIDANHSTPNLRARLHKAAENIQGIIDRFATLRLELESLRREPPERGLRLARWQALLHDAGFTWHEVAALFVYAPKRDSSPEAARKRAKKLLANEQEATRHGNWLEDLKTKALDI